MKLKIIAVVVVVVVAVLALIGYNKHTTSLTLPPEEQEVMDSFEAKAPQLQEINGRAKVSTANLVNLINSAETDGFDIKTFNFYSSNLLTISSELQVELDDILSLLNMNRPLFERSQIKEVWLATIDIYEFRNEYNQKLIQLAEIGARLNANDEDSLNRFVELATELETMESSIPDMQNRLIQTLSKFDFATEGQLYKLLEG